MAQASSRSGQRIRPFTAEGLYESGDSTWAEEPVRIFFQPLLGLTIQPSPVLIRSPLRNSTVLSWPFSGIWAKQPPGFWQR